MGIILSSSELEAYQGKFGTDRIVPETPTPYQQQVLLRKEKEIALLGGKYSGKSWSARAFLLKGNPDLPNWDQDRNPLLVNQSYIYHNGYRATILRRNQIDLDDFIRRFHSLVKPYGGTYRNAQFVFPGISDAVISVGHLADKDAWQKYIGVENIRFVIEEAALLPDINLYEQILTCCRSVYPELRPQVLITSNAGGPGTCVPYGDVLTPSGWKPIQDVKVGDSIYSVDSGRRLTETRVEQVHHLAYTGPLAHIHNRGLSMVCTPDHKVAYVPRSTSRRGSDYFDLCEFQKLPHQAKILRAVDWKGVPLPGISLSPAPRGRGKYKDPQPLDLTAEQYLRLLGWFLSEGFTVSGQPCVGIVQGKSPNKQELKAFLDSCGFRIYEPKQKEQYLIYGREWAEHFRPFGRAANKFIPQEIKNCPPDQLHILLDGLMSGDGSWGRRGSARRGIRNRCKWTKSGTYWTSSRRLADDVAEICLKLGYLVHVSCRVRPAIVMTIQGKQRKGVTTPLPAYAVNFRTTQDGCQEVATGNRTYQMRQEGSRPRGGDVQYEEFDGVVYCLGVPNTHTFVLRQNGSVWVSGNCWLIDRFYEAKDADGNIIPPGQTIYETHPDPYDPTQTVTTTRVFMFSTMQDNPHASKDPTYKATMAALTDEKLRKAYIYGDWRVFTGTYFEIFRPRGPNLGEGEPKWANHVIPAPAPTTTTTSLQPWWPRLGALDVGYAHETAAGWACRLPNSQHHIYREFVTSQSSFVQIGYELAKRSVDELNLLPSHSIPFYCSPDAFSSRMGKDAKSIIELVAIGIAKVLGPDAVHLPDLRIRQLKEAAIQDQTELSVEVIREIRSRRRLGITLHSANDDRVIGWQYCREALRWTIVGMDIPPFDPDLASALLLHNPDQYEIYTRIYESHHPEILPKLQIWDCCPRLIQAIPKARHYAIDTPGKSPEDVDKSHFVGMDSLDMWRYLEMGIEESFVEEPYESFRDRRMDLIALHHPGGSPDSNGEQAGGLTTRDRVLAHMAIEHQWAAKSNSAMILANAPRKSRRKKHEDYLARVRGLNPS